MQHLELIGLANIVRGGVYGLIGNSYLVIRAELIRAPIQKRQSKGKDVSKLLEEGEAIAVAYNEWQNAVFERETDIELDSGRPPKGKVWVDPSDKETEI